MTNYFWVFYSDHTCGGPDISDISLTKAQQLLNHQAGTSLTGIAFAAPKDLGTDLIQLIGFGLLFDSGFVNDGCQTRIFEET